MIKKMLKNLKKVSYYQVFALYGNYDNLENSYLIGCFSNIQDAKQIKQLITKLNWFGMNYRDYTFDVNVKTEDRQKKDIDNIFNNIIEFRDYYWKKTSKHPKKYFIKNDYSGVTKIFNYLQLEVERIKSVKKAYLTKNFNQKELALLCVLLNKEVDKFLLDFGFHTEIIDKVSSIKRDLETNVKTDTNTFDNV